MTYKIQVFNYDVMEEWMDYKAAGTFETEEEAEKERQRMCSIWTSMFKWSRVVPSDVKAEGLPEGYLG